MGVSRVIQSLTRPHLVQHFVEIIHKCRQLNSKFPFFICCAGIIELHRFSLVICSSFITSQVTKLFLMIMICLVTLLAYESFHPYQSSFIRATIISIISQLLVGNTNLMFTAINLVEASVPKFPLPTLELLFYVKDILKLFIPIILVMSFTVHNNWHNVNCRQKGKPAAKNHVIP